MIILPLTIIVADDRGALNLALKDQIAALEWVQENIGEFGGDKKKVGLSTPSTQN
jgi:carboxylesterase type B